MQTAQKIQFGFELHHLLWTSIWLLYEFGNFESSITLLGAATAREILAGQRIYPNQVQYYNQYVPILLEKRDANPLFQMAYDRRLSDVTKSSDKLYFIDTK